MKIVIHTFLPSYEQYKVILLYIDMFYLRLKMSNIQNKKKDKKEIGNNNFSTSLNTYVSYVQR